MEGTLASFLCKMGGLRFELKNFAESVTDETRKGELKRTLAQLDLVTLTIGKIRSKMCAQFGQSSPFPIPPPSVHRAIDFYQNLLCAEIPHASSDWVIWQRDATSVKLYQIVSNATDGTLEMRNRVVLEFLPETSESLVKFALKYAAMGDESVCFEFRPEHFLESTFGVLQNTLEVKFPVDPGVKVESGVEDGGIGTSANAERLEGGGVHRPSPRKRRRPRPPPPPPKIKYENLDETEAVVTNSSTKRKSRETNGDRDYRPNESLFESLAASPRKNRPSRNASAFAQYTESLDGDDDIDDDPATEDPTPVSDSPAAPTEKAELSFADDETTAASTDGETLSETLSALAKRRAGRPTKKELAARKRRKEEADADAEAGKPQKKPEKDDWPICRLCGAKVSRYKSRYHMRDVHQVIEFQCCFCLNIYLNDEDLRKHIHTTHGKKQDKSRAKLLPCKECDLPLCENECIDHNRIEHQKPLECPYCDYGSTLKDPSEMNVRLLLQQALTTSTPESKLKRHVYNDHFNKVFKRHRCLYCQTSFKVPEMLEEHCNRDLDPALRKVSICAKMRAEGEMEPKTICSHCGQAFNVTYIQIHIRRVHEKSLQFKYKCQFCPKRYEHPKRLRAHLLQFHFPEKKDIGCHLCPKKFASHRMLRQHILTHSSPAVKCPKCEKVFRTKNNMKQHLLSHYPPQYECLVCNRKFVYRCGLKTHLQQVHKYQDWENYIRKEPREDPNNVNSLTDMSFFQDLEDDVRTEPKLNQNASPFEVLNSFSGVTHP